MSEQLKPLTDEEAAEIQRLIDEPSSRGVTREQAARLLADRRRLREFIGSLPEEIRRMEPECDTLIDLPTPACRPIRRMPAP